MKSLARLPEQMKFQGNLTENFNRFIQNFELYLVATEKDEKPDRIKIAILLNTMGSEAVDIFNTFKFPVDANREDYAFVVSEFRKYCEPRIKKGNERLVFNNLVQNPGEPFHHFFGYLKKSVQSCILVLLKFITLFWITLIKLLKHGRGHLLIILGVNNPSLQEKIEELFKDIKNGNSEAIDKLRAVKPDEFFVIINARNNQGNTLLQVAIANNYEYIADNLLKILKETDQVHLLHLIPEYELYQLEQLKSLTKNLIFSSQVYFPLMGGNWPLKNVKTGSYYLGNAYDLVQVYKNYVPYLMNSIDNKSIQLINDTLVVLEFDPKHMSQGFTDEAYDGKTECFVSKGQGSIYYKLLHSKFNEDVQSFITTMKLNIETPARTFLESIEQRLQRIKRSV